MTNTTGHFDLSTPEALYDKAVHDYSKFFKSPDSWSLFNLLTTFTHLLEWICPEAKGKQPDICFVSGTKQQQFYYQMWNRNDYKLIRALCNNSKHFNHKTNGPTTSVIKGARAGLLCAGDSLGQEYFIVDGKDIREMFVGIYRAYKQYFEEQTRLSIS